MLDAPQIVQTAARLIAVLRLTVPREEIQKVTGPVHGEAAWRTQLDRPLTRQARAHL